MAKRPTQFGVTVGGTQFTFSDQPVTRSRRQGPLITVNNDGLPVSTSAGWVVPDSGALPKPARAERPQRTGHTRQPGWLVGLIMGAIKRYREGQRIDELHRLEIAQRGKCSTRRCPWPRAVTDKCTRCESDLGAHRPPVVIHHRCIDGHERPFNDNGSCGGPCPTSLDDKRRARKTASTGGGG